MAQEQTKKPKPSKHLVPIGTHVPTAVKMGLQAIAESKNLTLYALLQEMATSAVDEYNEQLRELDKRAPKEQAPASDEDLLS